MSASKSKLIYYIISDLRPYRALVALSLLLCIPQLAATLYIPVLTGKAVENISKSPEGQADFFNTMLFIAVCTIIASFIQCFINAANNKIAYRTAYDIRARLFSQIQELPFSYLDTQSSESYAAKAVADIEIYTDGLLLGFSRLFTGVLTIAFTIIMMFSIDSYTAVIASLLIPVCIAASTVIAKKTFGNSKKSAILREKLFRLAAELCSNAATVKALSYGERAGRRFAAENESFRKQHLKTVFLTSMANPFTRLLSNISFAVVCAFSAYFAISGKIGVGAFTAMMIYSARLGKPVTEITSVFTEFTAAMASAIRLHELLSEKIESDKPKNSALIIRSSGVKFEDATFSYDKSRPFLQNFSLDVLPGMRVAVVGPTGSGKTTLMNLLMRFYELDNGRIYIDGKDSRNISRPLLRKNIGIVLQDNWLKSGTIRENIAYGKAGASFEAVRLAAIKAEADDFIRQMSNGYDTCIGENGQNLSEGQKQLICIARTMLAEPQILILDEATGYIDTLTEKLVNNALLNLSKGKTVFTVAHRLSTIMDADLILVMDKGNVTELGSHDTLLAKGGFYAELVNAQRL